MVPLRCLVVACAFARVAGYTARSHRAHLSLLAGDTAIEEKGPSDAKAKVTTCSKCGFNDKGAGNCCSKGGAWQGTCKDEGGDHTFVDGFNACIGANEMAAPPDLSDVVVSEHGSEQTMPSLYAGAFEADKPAAPADEKKHQFEAKGSAPDAEPAAPAAEAAPAEAQQAAPPPAEAQPKLPALEDMPADDAQQQAAPAEAKEAAAPAPKAAAPANADPVSAAEDAYMKGLKQPAVDDQAILDDPDAEGMRKQKLAEEKAAAIERGEQAKPAADAGPVSEASQKVIDDYNDAWKEHNEKQDRTKCQAPDGTPLPCEQVLTNAEEILDTANKEAEKFEKEANAAPQGDPTAKDYVGLPLAEKGFVPEAVSATRGRVGVRGGVRGRVRTTWGCPCMPLAEKGFVPEAVSADLTPTPHP